MNFIKSILLIQLHSMTLIIKNLNLLNINNLYNYLFLYYFFKYILIFIDLFEYFNISNALT
jgi:hypothetical protein